MSITEAIQEFGFDCKIRKLSPKTIANYQKQIKYLQRFLLSEFKVENVEDVKSIHIMGTCFSSWVSSSVT